MAIRILHIIDSLNRGGAENIVANTISDLKEFDHTIVLLDGKSDFEITSSTIYNLNHTRKHHIFRSVLKLRKIVKENKIKIVHAHLFWSTIIARIACAGLRVKFHFTIHTMMSKDSFDNSWVMTTLEKLTYRSNHIAIGVSESVLKDYDKTIGIKGESHVLYNFVNDAFFKNQPTPKWSLKSIKLVAVGNIKPVKNYDLLIETFKKLDNSYFSLDIYGEGPALKQYQKHAKKHNLNIDFKGKNDGLDQLLSNYDIFIMPSFYEGFGIAPIEAMAIGLPVLLSDIPTFREIAAEVAHFFDPNNSQSLVELLQVIRNEKIDLNKLSALGKEKAHELSSKKRYLERLSKIYLSNL